MACPPLVTVLIGGRMAGALRGRVVRDQLADFLGSRGSGAVLCALLLCASAGFTGEAATDPAPAVPEAVRVPGGSKASTQPDKPAAKLDRQEEEEDPLDNLDLRIERREEPVKPCEHCGDDGCITLEAAKKPYVLFEGEEVREPAESLGWTPCHACLRGMSTKRVFEGERKRAEQRATLYKRHEDAVGMAFVEFETRHITGHFQTSPAEARECAMQIERLSALLREQCGESFLVTRRPTHRLVVLENAESYQKYLKWFASVVPKGGEKWLPLALKSASFGCRVRTIIRRDRVVKGAGLGPLSVFSFGQMQVKEASNGTAPGWFCEGFASLCESLVFPVPRCYSIRYEENTLEFEGGHWSRSVAKGIRAKKARKWESLFHLDQIGMSVLDYQLCWSVVAYLFMTDGKAFSRIPLLFRQGLDSAKTLEKAYKRSLPRLEREWRTWALKHR